jgi:hypothetical protein
MSVVCETANAGLPTVETGQSRLDRAGSSFGHVGYPPTATDFSGAATFRDVPEAAVSTFPRLLA